MRLTLSLRAWMVVSHLLVMSLPFVALVGTGALARELEMEARGNLIHQGAAIARLVAPVLARNDVADLEAVGRSIAALEADTKTRVLLLDRVGRVVVSSDRTAIGAAMGGREEVAAALPSEGGDARVHWAVQPRRPPAEPVPFTSPDRRALVVLHVVTPVVHEGALVGLVHESHTPREVLQSLYFLDPGFTSAVLLAAAVTVGLSVASGHILSRSLRTLSRSSRRIADGSLAAVAELGRTGRSHVVEVGELSGDMATMAARLRERLGYITEFAGNVSHEFKTPITTLRGTVELLRDDDDMPAAQRQVFLDNALADLGRMERLVSGLLALARAEEAPDRRKVALDEVVAAVLARHPGVRWSGGGGEVVQADSAQLESALGNLVENALRHGGAGVGATVAVWGEGERAGIDVEDDGPGISEANLPRVFDRFFTTDRARGGAGLGLALVRAVAVAHGGGVEVESRPGRTRFRIWLPRGRTARG